MGGTLPSTGMWQGEVFAISDCLVLDLVTLICNLQYSITAIESTWSIVCFYNWKVIAYYKVKNMADIEIFWAIILFEIQYVTWIYLNYIVDHTRYIITHCECWSYLSVMIHGLFSLTWLIFTCLFGCQRGADYRINRMTCDLASSPRATI